MHQATKQYSKPALLNISCKFTNLRLCSSTSSERTATLSDKCAHIIYDDVIKVPLPNLNSANIYIHSVWGQTNLRMGQHFQPYSMHKNPFAGHLAQVFITRSMSLHVSSLIMQMLLGLVVVKEALHIQMTPVEEIFNRDGGLEVPGCWTTVMRRQGERRNPH